MSAAVRTFKFLGKGAVGPFSARSWPVARDGGPGEWVTVEGHLELGRHGIHVCRAGDLAHWLHDELWETEADGDAVPGRDCLVVRRARLIRRIDGWNAESAARFAEAAIERAAAEVAGGPGGEDPDALGLLEDARMGMKYGFAAVAAFSAAFAVARVTDSVEAHSEAFRRERSWQSGWLEREIVSSP